MEEEISLYSTSKKWYNTIQNMASHKNPHNICKEETTKCIVCALSVMLFIIFFVLGLFITGRITSAALGKVPFGSNCTNIARDCCFYISIPCFIQGVLTFAILAGSTLSVVAIILFITNYYKKINAAYKFATTMDRNVVTLNDIPQKD